jgi:hypothetical protein
VDEAEAQSLNTQTVVSTGTLNANAETLLTTEDGTPLLARRTFGSGTVDYLTADPNTQPLRGWGHLPDLWFTLLTNTGATPGWSHGYGDWEQAGRAVEILPGYDPLPDILPLCGFLFNTRTDWVINYFVLNRINRREWAWITIPVFILLFSVASYVLGFNLRGSKRPQSSCRRAVVVDMDRARRSAGRAALAPARTVQPVG